MILCLFIRSNWIRLLTILLLFKCRCRLKKSSSPKWNSFYNLRAIQNQCVIAKVNLLTQHALNDHNIRLRRLDRMRLEKHYVKNNRHAARVSLLYFLDFSLLLDNHLENWKQYWQVKQFLHGSLIRWNCA